MHATDSVEENLTRGLDPRASVTVSERPTELCAGSRASSGVTSLLRFVTDLWQSAEPVEAPSYPQGHTEEHDKDHSLATPRLAHGPLYRF